jgi:hypothetical protein
MVKILTHFEGYTIMYVYEEISHKITSTQTQTLNIILKKHFCAYTAA